MRDNNKKVITCCPNFYKIRNFNYSDDDYITERLIHIYEDYIFKVDISQSENINSIKTFDYVLGKYIEDYFFRKAMAKELIQVKIKKNCEDVLKTIVESIIAIFNHYEDYTTRNIYISRWI